MTPTRLLSVCLFASLLSCPLWSGTLHVSVDAAPNGDGSPQHPYATIQAAADAVKPGDTVLIGPGVYFEHVNVTRFGTAEAPIIFKADKIQRDRVVITGAHKAIRQGTQKWELHDPSTGTYKTPWQGGSPGRALYDGVDLFPYRSLEGLLNFYAQPGLPGPRHGFFQEDGVLYVRLRPDGKYGSANPNDHLMAIAPPFLFPDLLNPEGESYGFALRGPVGTPRFIILDGFTFETPGFAGVFPGGSNVTVRNCVFLGTCTGVRGTCTLDCANVTLEHCEWHNFPVFDDAEELLDDFLHKRRPVSKEHSTYPFWTHKTTSRARVVYEFGIVDVPGRNWTIRHCHIHDAFEGLAGLYIADGTILEDNLWERLIDNAVELEDHAVNTHIRRNRFIDTAQPISLQPLQGLPWPGSNYVYQNLFSHSEPPRFPVRFMAVFKLGAPKQQVLPKEQKANPPDITDVRLPGNGLLIFNNTIIDPQSTLIEWTTTPRQYLHPVVFANNLAITASSAQDASWLNPAAGTSGTLEQRVKQLEEHPKHLWGLEYIQNRFGWLNLKFTSPKAMMDQSFPPNDILPQWRQFSFLPQTFTPSAPVPNAPASFPYMGALQSPADNFAQDVGPLFESGK